MGKGLLLLPIWLILTTLLAGCDPIYCTSYQYTPPTSQKGKKCVKQCLKQKRQCTKNCPEKYLQCVKQKRQKALEKYQKYVQKHKQQNKPVTKDADYFIYHAAAAYHCEKYCHCHWYFAHCYSDCGGKVQGDKCSTDYHKVLRQRGYDIDN